MYPDGEPKSPKGAKTTVVNQCGYYVRENIPISFRLWKKSNATNSDDDIVPEIEKEMLWADVKRHFSFLEDEEELFKDWTEMSNGTTTSASWTQMLYMRRVYANGQIGPRITYSWP